MKALPFPCIRPARDRVLEALPQMGGILSSNDALRDAIADGLMLKDPGAAYYAYECSGEPGRVTGVVAICPVGVLACDDAPSAGTAAAARAIAALKVQPRPVTLVYEASPVMDTHPRRRQRGRVALCRHRPRRHYAPRVGGQARGRRCRHPSHARPGTGADAGRRPRLRYRAGRSGAAFGRRGPRSRHLHGQRAVQLYRCRVIPRRAGHRRRTAGSNGPAHPPNRTVLTGRKRPVQRLGRSTNKGRGYMRMHPRPFHIEQ